MTEAYDLYPELTPRYDTLGVHPHTIPAVDIFDSPGVNVFINAEWASHLTGMIERLIYLDAWEGTEAEKYAAIDKVVKIISEFDKAENQGDKWIMQAYSPFYLHFHKNSKILNGSDISGVINTGQEFNTQWRQFPSAINDEFYFKILLPAGQIDIDICYISSAGGGIVTFSMDDKTDITWNLDFYNGTTQVNRHAAISFEADSNGVHTIKGKVASKNASSSGYTVNMTYLSIEPHYA